MSNTPDDMQPILEAAMESLARLTRYQDGEDGVYDRPTVVRMSIDVQILHDLTTCAQMLRQVLPKGERPVAMCWQPIETAPLDGTEVLTFRGAGLQAVAIWTGREWCVTDGMFLSNVTHWMPLPEPPTNTTASPDTET